MNGKMMANVRITNQQKEEIKELAHKNNKTYSDMFRLILQIGITTFKLDTK